MRTDKIERDGQTLYRVVANPNVLDAEGNPQGCIGQPVDLGFHAAGQKLILDLGPRYYPLRVTVAAELYGPTYQTGRHVGVQMDHLAWEEPDEITVEVVGALKVGA